MFLNLIEKRLLLWGDNLHGGNCGYYPWLYLFHLDQAFFQMPYVTTGEDVCLPKGSPATHGNTFPKRNGWPKFYDKPNQPTE